MEQKYGLVVAVVNHGNVDEIMDAARAAGATGGTVLNARSVVNENVKEFFGITVHPEKDIITIITRKENELAIMQAIQNNEFLDEDEKAIVFSLPVEQLIGIQERVE